MIANIETDSQVEMDGKPACRRWLTSHERTAFSATPSPRRPVARSREKADSLEPAAAEGIPTKGFTCQARSRSLSPAPMRSLLKTLCLLSVLTLLVTGTPSTARAEESGVAIARVFTGWRTADSFKRISEYFSGRENTRDSTVLRTQPGERAGFYFYVRAVNEGAPVAVKINVTVIKADTTTPKTYAFATELPSGKTILNLGLTGADWPGADAHPVAWKIDFQSADGRELATKGSYLWERPATP